MTDRPPSYPGSEDSTLPPPTVTIAASRTSEATCGSSGKELDRQQDEQEVVAKVSLLVEFNGVSNEICHVRNSESRLFRHFSQGCRKRHNFICTLRCQLNEWTHLFGT